MRLFIECQKQPRSQGLSSYRGCVKRPFAPAFRSNGTKSHLLVSMLHNGTSRTMQLAPVHLDLSLFWKSHCATCSPANVICTM